MRAFQRGYYNITPPCYYIGTIIDWVKPWHLLYSYSTRQLWGKLLHELRFLLYEAIPILGRRYAREANPEELAQARQQGPLSSLLPFEAKLPSRAHSLRPIAPIASSKESSTTSAKSPASFLFTFAGESHELQSSYLWQSPSASRLFLFELHGFDWLRELCEHETIQVAQSFFADWIIKNPPPQLEAWHPYCISRRLLNLFAALPLLQRGQDEAIILTYLNSIYQQAQFLAAHLESFLGGNHLLSNLIALASAAYYFGPQKLGKTFLQLSLEPLEQELSWQIRKDGGHCEGSYGYHMEILFQLKFLAEVEQRSGCQTSPWLCSSISMMESWSRRITHGLKTPPLFGDSWRSAPLLAPEAPESLETPETPETPETSETPEPPETSESPEPSEPPKGSGLTVLPSSGFLKVDWGLTGDSILFSFAPFGAPGQPGHGHCDSTGYEIFCNGRNLICDSGNLHYRKDSKREYFRSSQAHNVIRSPGVEQTELFHVFRAGKKSESWMEDLDQGPELISFTLFCRPAQDLGLNLLIERRVRIVVEQAIVIFDSIHGLPRGCPVSSSIHISPEGSYKCLEKGIWRIALAGESPLWLIPLLCDDLVERRGLYAPELGECKENPVLELVCKNDSAFINGAGSSSGAGSSIGAGSSSGAHTTLAYAFSKTAPDDEQKRHWLRL